MKNFSISYSTNTASSFVILRTWIARAKISLFRHKVDNNLSSPRFGTYGLKGGKVASMRGEFLGIEVRLRVRKRAKWCGERERESLARLWRRASIRISNTSISTYFHDKEYSSFVKVLRKLLPWILNERIILIARLIFLIFFSSP